MNYSAVWECVGEGCGRACVVLVSFCAMLCGFELARTRIVEKRIDELWLKERKKELL